jgi:hypothetical protein
LLKEKKNQLQNQASKLRGGLSTLNATRKSVAEMQIVCQDKAVVVAQAKKECEEILVEIVSEKRVVDEQELKVKKPFSLSLSLSCFKAGFCNSPLMMIMGKKSIHRRHVVFGEFLDLAICCLI